MTAPAPKSRDSISASEVLPLAEVARRLGWGQRTIRRAQREGLRCVAFGKCKYCLGADVLAFFQTLAENQNGVKHP